MKTYQRILAGLHKFVLKGNDNFIQQYYSGKPDAKVYSVDNPCRSITTIDHNSIVSIEKNWIVKYLSKEYLNQSLFSLGILSLLIPSEKYRIL